MSASKQKVLILGGGFGGVKAALELENSPDFKVTLLSDQQNFRYYPALYRAATGSSPKASTIALSEIFEGKNVHIEEDTAKQLQRDKQQVSGRSGKKYQYDILIIALGAVTNFFGIKGLKEHAYGIKTLDEAQQLRAHLHKLMLAGGKPDLNYIVVGGGPTGVELAGALPAYLRHVQKKHNLPKKTIHVDLVEAMPRLLPRLPRAYSHAVQKRLRKLGVKIYLDTKVEAETADELLISGRSIESQTVVWTAGVTNHPFFEENNFALSEHGKAIVDEQLRAGENIYVIGDNAETIYSGMAQTALHDAIFVAASLKRLVASKDPLTYKARKPVYITAAGKRWAAVLWGNFHIYGWLGWALRRGADLVAYHDLEPWWKAKEHWLADSETIQDCKICK